MEMLLMGICISVFGLAVAAMAFGVATRPESGPQLEVRPAKAVAPGRFFVDYVDTPAAGGPRVPIEALLRQIENHVRLEQAAAESFVEFPTPAALRSKTVSTLVN